MTSASNMSARDLKYEYDAGLGEAGMLGDLGQPGDLLGVFRQQGAGRVEQRGALGGPVLSDSRGLDLGTPPPCSGRTWPAWSCAAPAPCRRG